MALYEINRAKVVQSMLKQDSSIRGLILLEGGKQTTRYDTDHEPVFRQESYFHYLFGASQYSDCYGVLSIPSGEATLFVPTWGGYTTAVCGNSPEFEQVKKDLGLERVMGVCALEEFIDKEMKRLVEEDEEKDGQEEKKKNGEPKLYLLKGLNTGKSAYLRSGCFFWPLCIFIWLPLNDIHTNKVTISSLLSS